jgi:hypothetical protein
MAQFIGSSPWLLSLVPLAGLVLTVWQILRTRRSARWGKVNTLCQLTTNTKRNGDLIVQAGPASLLVEVVNYGPGEVTIHALKGRYRDGSIGEISLRATDQKLRQQGDRLARSIIPIDRGQYDGFYNEAGIELVDIWFEDTFGRKHKLKHVRKHLRTLREVI